VLARALTEDATLGVVEHHVEVGHGVPVAQPGVGRGVEVEQHAAHGPALASTPVLAPGRGLLGQPGRLQRQQRPRVGQLELVALGGVLPEVAHREVGVGRFSNAR